MAPYVPCATSWIKPTAVGEAALTPRVSDGPRVSNGPRVRNEPRINNDTKGK